MTITDAAQATAIPDGLLELARTTQNDWASSLAALRASGVPLNAGDETTTTSTTTTDAATASGKTFTQEQVNDLIAREKGTLQRRYGDYDDLKAKASKFDELANSQKSDLERLTGERDTFKTTAEQTAAENLRLRVAVKKQIPAELIDRLRGSTEKELEDDADGLLKLVSPSARSFDGGARTTSAPQDMDSLIRQSAGYAT